MPSEMYNSQVRGWAAAVSFRKLFDKQPQIRPRVMFGISPARKYAEIE